MTERQRDIEVLLCGYAYPSRKRFVDKLLPLLEDLKVTLVGDGWEYVSQEGVTTMPTQPLAETYALHARARTVVCLHRVHGDCSDGAVEPVTMNRGYLEGISGARVFMDKTRPLHGLDDGDVVWYSGYGDLAGALWASLKVAPFGHAGVFAEKCRTNYTYKTRLARLINCVRAPRYLAEIP
jgi:hypothetical protein